MSLASELQKRTAAAYDRIQCDDIQILSGDDAGLSFQGDLQTEAPFELSTDLGTDAREKTVMYVNRPAPALESQDRIQIDGREWTVVKRDDNEGNERVKFEIIKRAPGIDT